MLGGFPHRRTGFARTLAALALLAMAARALVAPGYMLAPSSDGRFLAVTLCSGQGAVETLVDLETGAVVESSPKGPSKTADIDTSCVFAAASALAAPQAPAMLGVALRGVSIAAPRAHTVAPGRGLAAPPPWSTGPPLTA